MEDMQTNSQEAQEAINRHEANGTGKQWFVMRDLTRPNAQMPAYKMLEKMKIDFFTPMVHKLVMVNGKREDREVPFMQDLIFVHEVQTVIDPIVENVHTFQYRFLKQRKPMTVRDADMKRFIQAVESSEKPKFYRPSEITPEMLSRKIRIIGGQLDGYEGTLLTLRGSKVKRLLVELPTLLAAAVEVQPEFIRLID